MDNDKSITSNFVPQVIQTEMAMSTPIMSIQSETPDPQFGFDMPTRSDWTYSVQVHRNGQAGFSYLTAFDGTGSSVHVADKNVKNYFASYYCVYAEPKPVSPIVPFLSFPMTNDNQAEMTAYSATATAVFDNDGVGDKANGWILLCTGQLLTFAQDRCVKLLNNQTVLSTSFSASDIVGYMMNSAGDDVVLPFFYNDLDGSLSPGLKGTIWYDGHTGYDYRVGPNTHVIAAAHGRVTGDSSFNHNTAFNQLVIECDNGYKTYYLHMNSWDQAFKEGDEIQEGQRIGVPGDIGANGEHTGAVHLHFTVKEPQTDKGFKRVDPYGLLAEDKTVVSPILWKKQPFN
jgi:hypothetical protein